MGSLVQSHPYRFTGLLVLLQLFVGGAAGALATAAGFGPLAVWGATSVALGAVEVLLLTRLNWWHRIGFRRAMRPRVDLLLWLPLCPILVWNLSQLDVSAIVTPARMGGLFLVTVLGAFVEDVLYRGLMLRALEPKGVWRAALTTAALFGAMHIFNALGGASPGAVAGTMAYAASIGFAYAAYVLHTGLIWPVVVMHALANFADLIDQENVFQESAATAADLTRWLIYFLFFALYGILVLRSVPGSRADALSDRS